MGSVDHSLEVGYGVLGGIVEPVVINIKEEDEELPKSQGVEGHIKETLEAGFIRLYGGKLTANLEENARLKKKVQQLMAELEGLKGELNGSEEKVQQLGGELQESNGKLEVKEKEAEHLNGELQEATKTFQLFQKLKNAVNALELLCSGSTLIREETTPASASLANQKMQETMEDQDNLGCTSEPETEQDFGMDTESCPWDDGEASRPLATPPSLVTEAAAGTDPVENEDNDAIPIIVSTMTMTDFKEEATECDNGQNSDPNLWNGQPLQLQPESFLTTLDQPSGFHWDGTGRKKGRRGPRGRGLKNRRGDLDDFDLEDLIFPNGRAKTFYELRSSAVVGGQARVPRFRRWRRRSANGPQWKVNQEIGIHRHKEVLVDEAHGQFCCSCGMDSFASKQTLLQHINYFTMPWKFSCKYCGSGGKNRFRNVHNLREHMRKAHNKNDLEGKTGCTKCGEVFDWKKGALKLHQRTGCTIDPVVSQ